MTIETARLFEGNGRGDATTSTAVEEPDRDGNDDRERDDGTTTTIGRTMTPVTAMTATIPTTAAAATRAKVAPNTTRTGGHRRLESDAASFSFGRQYPTGVAVRALTD